MKIKIGDKVIIDKKKALGNSTDHNFLPPWYSDKIFTVIEIDNNVISLDKNLLEPIGNTSGNIIHIEYLKLLRKDRKKKLLKLNSI